MIIAPPRLDTRIDQAAFNIPVAGWSPVPLALANDLLTRWGHSLGPVNRPFGSQSWVLEVEQRPVAVAVSASTVSATITGRDHTTCGPDDECHTHPGHKFPGCGEEVHLERGEVVELARLCVAPGCRWATRPALRLWREVAAPRWPYWPLTTAVSYSQNARHAGSVYRFDGWTRISTDRGSSGGGTWSGKRDATQAVHGQKSLWIWRYEAAEAGEAA